MNHGAVSHLPGRHTGSAGFDFSTNNFDLIRLIAASEVVIRHSIVHIAPDQFPGWLKIIFALVPGVPIFFFLSGFLISRSWERSTSVNDYCHKRALRLFPALWICIAVSVTAIFLTGYAATVDWSWVKGVAWVIGQGTMFQFWTPDFLRNFGVGAVNGSLWSVSVEIQFYCVTPLMYWVLSGFRPSLQTALMCALAVFFASFNVFRDGIQAFLDTATGSELGAKLFGVTFLPWYFMFLIGVLAQRLRHWLIPICQERALAIIVLYVLSMNVDFLLWGLPLGNEIPFYLVPIMGLAVLSLAYSSVNLSSRVLRGNDISYGIYIYHMPVVNVLVERGWTGSWSWVWVVFAVSVGIGITSWRFIEAPLLLRKRVRQMKSTTAT